MTRTELIEKKGAAYSKLEQLKSCVHILGSDPKWCKHCRENYDYICSLLKEWENKVAPPSKIALDSDKMGVLEDYITNYGLITLRTIPETEDYTKERFFDITGYELNEGMQGYKKEDYYRHDGTGRQSSYNTAGKIHFNAEIGKLLRDSGFPLSASNSIHDTGYVWDLLSRGFNLGRQRQAAEKEEP